jgi:archaeosortase A (PGF-CTERM-specific)
MSGPVATVLDGLAALGRFSDPLAWVVIVAFGVGWALEGYDRDLARRVATGAWVAFSFFWLTLVHHFAFAEKSIVEGIGVAVAVPACLSAAVLLYRGRDSLFVLSRSVAVMGVLYFPFETIPWLRQTAIEAVTVQTEAVIRALGYSPRVTADMAIGGFQIPEKTYPYRSTFVWQTDGGHYITYTIVTACTGIGSIAIFGGLIPAIDAPLERKLRAFFVSVPVIYALNIARNVLISVGFGTQAFQVFPEGVMALFAVDDPYMVSYYVADRIIAQGLSAVALVAITVLVVRQLPEMVTVVEDFVYVLTRREYDLRGALGVEARPVRTDGEGVDGE